MLGDVARHFLGRKSLKDHPAWLPFLRQLPAPLLPPVFEVHALLGRAGDAASLAQHPAQIEEAIRLCLEDRQPDALRQGLILAEQLANKDRIGSIHQALGQVLAEAGDWSGALLHYRVAGNEPEQSLCHEKLGDLWEALRLCPIADEARRLRLIERLEQQALETAGRGDVNAAMAALTNLRRLLIKEGTASGACLALQGILERHRAEVLRAGRQSLQKRLADAATPQPHREELLALCAFEELAGEWGEAALVLEKTGDPGDRLRASQLWEKDERYGEAVRSLGPLCDRQEVQLRMAQLREAGGDAAGAAALFEVVLRWSDARRAYEAAGQWAEAARCYRQEHGEARALEAPEFANLLAKAERIDELLQLYLKSLDQTPSNPTVLNRLGALVRERGSQIQSPQLRALAAARLAKVVTSDLRQRFEKTAGDLVDQARAEVQKRYGRIWGMDLGTSKSAVSLFDLENGVAVICPHKRQPHFPSTLAIDKSGNEIVGLDALEQLRPDLRGCIERSKRSMGTRKVYRIADRHFSPEEVAARLLTHGKGIAEAFLRDEVCQRVMQLARQSLGEECSVEWIGDKSWIDRMTIPVPDAVVTVPAYFNFDQRRATRDAAEIAGIKVHRLVAEPTAACLSAGLSRRVQGKMLIVDLGAGTLDVSYLDASLDKGGGVYDVEQVFGDTQFGSSDMDSAIEQALIDRLKSAGLPEPTGIDRRRLRAAAEQMKIALSTSQNATYDLVSFAGRDRVVLELSAIQLEDLLKPHLERLEAVCRQAVGLPLDHLVLVGGPMFSPIIRARIERLVGRKADAVVDPRTAVAMGAACQGAMLSNHGQVPFLLLDVTPFALGVLTHEGASRKPTVTFHIPRGTSIPHQNRRLYVTTEDNQPAVDVHVFQGIGDSTEPAANKRLGLFRLDGLLPTKAGETKIDISFEIDANGLLEVIARNEKTGKKQSSRFEDTLWLSPSERNDMTERMTKGQRWAGERAELSASARQLRALLEKLLALEAEDAAKTWQRHFESFQRSQKSPSFGHLDAADQALLAEMYNGGQVSCDQFLLELDRVRNLPARCQRFLDAEREVNLLAAEADLETHLRNLRELGRQLEGQLNEALNKLEPLSVRFQHWRAALVHCGTLHADPRDRMVACHEAGEWQRAVDAYSQAFSDTPAAEVPLAMMKRHLDALARLGRRAAYRQVLADQGQRLNLRDLQFDRLNEFVRHVVPGIAWLFVRDLGTGSGFLAAPTLVVTNRHVILDGERPTTPDRVVVHVGGVPCRVAQIHLPPGREVDLAVLELREPANGPPVRVGYSGLVEVGEQVLVMGFPVPEGESFEENLLLDHGIVNRMRNRPDRRGREFELGLRISPGMSGGPVFNDQGEVIAVSSFVRYLQPGGQQGPILDKSSHAIAVDALRELLPLPW